MSRVERRALFDFQKENELIELMFADRGSKMDFSGPGSEAYLHIFFASSRSGFYLHKLFGWPGFCILLTQTFRVAGVFAFYLHTHSG